MAVSVLGMVSLIFIMATELSALASRNLTWHHSAQQAMRKAIVVVVVAGALLSGWLIYARQEARQAVYRAAQAKRDAAYQVVLAQYQRDLQLSTPRSGVKRYLDLKQVSYSEWEWTISTKIGDDPGDGFTCDRWGSLC